MAVNVHQMPCSEHRLQYFFIFKMRSSFAASLKRQINLNYFYFPNRANQLIYIEENLHERFKRQVLSNTSMFFFEVDGYLFTAVQP